MEDYYALLGVQRNASDEEIRNAYNRLAMQYYPNGYLINAPGAAEQFQMIHTAFGILSNKIHRRNYDEYTLLDDNVREALGPQGLHDEQARLARLRVPGMGQRTMRRNNMWPDGPAWSEHLVRPLPIQSGNEARGPGIPQQQAQYAPPTQLEYEARGPGIAPQEQRAQQEQERRHNLEKETEQTKKKKRKGKSKEKK